MKIVALAGGVGGSKLLLGLYQVAARSELTIVVNTGDDIELHGLRISPDLDIVSYTLAGAVNPETGWGFLGDTSFALAQMAAYGRESWFHLGDRDLGTHLHRTAMLRAGASLSKAADSIRRGMGVEGRILPMSDQSVRTMIATDRGEIHFQEYLVKHRAEPVVRGIRFEGIEGARPAPGVLAAIADAEGIVICPSNPLISIGPILAVPGIREALRARREIVAAVCPLVGGKSLKGPSDKMLEQLGKEASAIGVARMYRDIAGTFLVDIEDAGQRPEIEALGMRVMALPTVMRTMEDKQALANAIVRLFDGRAQAAGA